jgi:hypothetical protein
MSLRTRRCRLAADAASRALGRDCEVWSQSRCDAQNQAAIELRAGQTTLPRAWSFDGSGRVWGYEPGLTIWSSPALGVAGDQPIVVAGNYDHTLYCLNAATGEPLWKFTTGGPIYAAPVFFRDGTRQMVFAASNDRIVYAIDPVLGRQIWVHAVEDFRPTLGGARLAAPCVGGTGDSGDKDNKDNAVFVPYWIWDRSLANSEQKSGVAALSVDDGHLLWRAELGDNELTAAIFVRCRGGRALPRLLQRQPLRDCGQQWPGPVEEGRAGLRAQSAGLCHDRPGTVAGDRFQVRNDSWARRALRHRALAVSHRRSHHGLARDSRRQAAEGLRWLVRSQTLRGGRERRRRALAGHQPRRDLFLARHHRDRQ